MKQKLAYNLTKRELEILKLIIAGVCNIEIAENLCITKNTVKSHVAAILKKLNSKNRLLAAIKAVKENITG